MGEGQEQDQYEERLKEVFNSFDASGSGSLSQDELSDLCQSLHLDDATPALIHALENQDGLTDRVDFERFKNALILVLSSTIEPPQTEQETLSQPDSPVIQPKFVKGSKRYGRRSAPGLMEPVTDSSSLVSSVNPEDQALEDNYDSAVPRKRERWNAHETTAEEYEAEGQMHLWNPDDVNTPRGSVVPLSAQLEESLYEACEELDIPWDGCAGQSELMALCELMGLEISGDVLMTVPAGSVTNVQEFVSKVVNHNNPPTPSASTPYRQLKRLHSTQPFDESGRRTMLSSTLATHLFSTLDDGTGHTAVKHVLDVWTEQGIENSTDILQALNFDLYGNVNLGDLTLALENELLVTKNGIHQAALASFKAEIRHLGERMDREIRQKEKMRSDLEKSERLKTQFATEMDEHVSAIELRINLDHKNLELEHKDKMTAMQSELRKEMDVIQQQAGVQREELEAEIKKIKGEESFLREHLNTSLKENGRLELELRDITENLMETRSQMSKLQRNLDNITKDKLGDLDQGIADFILQEERMKKLRCSYEDQCRDLQDRIEELQSELQGFHCYQSCNKPLSEELESSSPGMDSDPGIGSEEVRPFTASLESEMMLAQLKERHLQEVEELRNQLKTKITESDEALEKQRTSHEDQKSSFIHQQEIQPLQQEIVSLKSQTQELQNKLLQAKQEQCRLEQQQSEDREELENLQEEEVGALRQQLLEAHTYTADLEEQLKNLESAQEETEKMTEDLGRKHLAEVQRLKDEYAEQLEARLVEEKAVLEQRLSGNWAREKKVLEESHEQQLEKVTMKFEKERADFVKSLTEQWQMEKAQLDEQNNESLQTLLEEEMMKLVREQEEKENKLREQWERERARLQQQLEEDTLKKLEQERSQFEQREKRLKKEWELERVQLEEDYESMIQERLSEEKEKLKAEREEDEKKQDNLMEEQERLEERHREVVKELTAKHAEERDTLGTILTKLRDDIARERMEMEHSFNKKIKEMAEQFGVDQESMTQRFEADVLKLELHYHSELKVLSERHTERELHWEDQKRKAFEGAEEQTKIVEEASKQEIERLSAEWIKEREELQRVHSKEVEVIRIQNGQQLDEFFSKSQTREIELSRLLNDLHNRLQESLKTKQQLLMQSEDKAVELELLLNQTVEDFKHERTDLIDSYSELDAKHSEVLSLSNKMITERIKLEAECDNLRVKNEEMEMLLKQAALDFELERKELQESLDDLHKLSEEKKGKEHSEEVRADDVVEENEVTPVLTSVEIGIVNDCIQHDSEFVAQVIKNGDSKAANETENVTQCCNENVASSDDDDIHEFFKEEGTKTCQLKVEKAVVFQENWNCWVNVLDGYFESLDPSPDDCCHEFLEPTSNGYHHPEAPADCLLDRNTIEKPSELISSLKAFENGGNDLDELCAEENKPQGANHHVAVVETRAPEEMGDSTKLYLQDYEVLHLLKNSHSCNQGCVCVSEKQHLATMDKHECVDDCVETRDENSGKKLEGAPSSVKEENILLHQKMSLLVQKTEILEDLLSYNSDKISNFHQIIDENYSLKMKMLLLLENIRDQEMRALKMEDLSIQYEECLCENAKLKHQNIKLEKKVWILEAGMNIFHNIQSRQVCAADEISRTREETVKLSEMSGGLEMQDGMLKVIDLDTEESETTHLNGELIAKGLTVTDSDDCCLEFEQENGKLCVAISELQDKSQTPNERMPAHRSIHPFVYRVAYGNIILNQKTAALKNEELNEAHEFSKTLNQLKKEKFAAQKASGNCKKQISELRLQNQQLENDNKMLSEENGRTAADVENLRQQLEAPTEENKKREVFPAEERNQLAACVSALEVHLNKASEDSAQQEQRNIQLLQQLSESREKVSQLDATIVSLKQHKLLMKALQLENASLKQELQAQSQGSEAGILSELQNLKQQNKAMKVQMTQLRRRLNENQLVGLLPPSPHRSPRGQHRGEEPNVQEDTERKMKIMEERMREVELSLHNVRLLLKEKVVQLKDQVHKNGKADVLIKDLYVENTQLIKTLGLTQQRHQIAEKKNFLLEEKISSLNKIVRDLNPSPLTSLPYLYNSP